MKKIQQEIDEIVEIQKDIQKFDWFLYLPFTFMIFGFTNDLSLVISSEEVFLHDMRLIIISIMVGIYFVLKFCLASSLNRILMQAYGCFLIGLLFEELILTNIIPIYPNISLYYYYSILSIATGIVIFLCERYAIRKGTRLSSYSMAKNLDVMMESKRGTYEFLIGFVIAFIVIPIVLMSVTKFSYKMSLMVSLGYGLFFSLVACAEVVFFRYQSFKHLINRSQKNKEHK